MDIDIESGLRWGELTELRPGDLNFSTGIIKVTRVAIELMRDISREDFRGDV